MDRRQFLGHSARGFAYFGAASALAQTPAKVDQANDKIRLGMIGLGGRGRSHMFAMAQHPGVEIAYLCDPDVPGRIGSLPDKVEGFQGKRPKAVSDMRRVFEDPDVDAVFIATCDHWHALATIWACQAGKDVYVEKPPSHTVWDGRKMVEAARKYKRVVQVGLQNRSAEYLYAAREYIASGQLGEVPYTIVHNLKMGEAFKLPADSPVPEGVDYDLYLGPAPMRPFNRGHFHSGWLMFWEYCSSDIADDGIHQVDIARWLLGDIPYPKAVYARGGNYAFNDDRKVPDTLVATFEYDKHVVTFDMTEYANYMEKASDEIRNGDLFPYWPQNSERIELFGTKGLMYVCRQGGGWQVLDRGGKVVAQHYGRHTTPEHQDNFLECVRSRKQPNADIEIGHHSHVLCQLGAIATRLGGRRLVFDGASEAITNDSEANALLRGTYREPYVVPEQV